MRGRVAVLFTRGDTNRVKAATVVGFGTTMVTLVLAKAFKFEREMDADDVFRV